jgi:hypothetical protein
MCLAAKAAAAPVLTAAEAVIRFTSPLQCDVRLTLAVSGGADVEHRLELLEGARVELAGIEGATEARPAREIGRTRALVLTPTTPGASYTLAYRVAQSTTRPNRCPLWLPTAPADGRSRNVRLTVHLPGDTVASGTMPAFTWEGAVGTAVVPHLPAFVVVPFTGAGQTRPWDVSRVMDAVALGTLALASAVWLRRQQRARV